MGVNNGKFFDVKRTSGYFDNIIEEYDRYKTNAEQCYAVMEDFGAEEQWQGVDAESGKKLISRVEYGIVSDIVNLQDSFKSLYGEILELFACSVENAADARIEYDILESINNDFQGKYADFDSLTKTIKQEVGGYQAKYSKYGDIRTPDFSSGVDAFNDLCGGDAEKSGYLYECMDKLVQFDDELKGLIDEKGFSEIIENIADRLKSFDETYGGNGLLHWRPTGRDIICQEIKDIMAKDISEWTEEDAYNIAWWYNAAIESGDKAIVSAIYNGLAETSTEKYKDVDENGKRVFVYTYETRMNPEKTTAILYNLELMGHGNTEGYDMLATLAVGGYSICSDKKAESYNSDINISSNSEGLVVDWEITLNGECAGYNQGMIFKEDGLSLDEKYDRIGGIDGIECYRLQLKELRMAQKISDYQNVANNSDFSQYSGYIKEEQSWGFHIEFNTGNKFDESEVYQYINNDNRGRYMNVNDRKTFLSDHYELMTDEQISIYNYLYQMDKINGTDDAETYRKLLAPSLRQKFADQAYDESNHLENAGWSFVAGIDKFGKGVRQATGINADMDQDIDGDQIQTSLEYINQKITADATGGWSWVYQGAYGAGYGLAGTSIGMMTAGGGIPGAVGVGLTGLAYGSATYGNSLGDAQQAGYTAEQAQAYATAMGFKEGAKTAAFYMLMKGAGKAGSLTNHPVATAVGIDAAGAFAIEYGDETVLTPYINSETLGRDVEVDKLTAVQNASLAAILNGAATYVYTKRMLAYAQENVAETTGETTNINSTPGGEELAGITGDEVLIAEKYGIDVENLNFSGTVVGHSNRPYQESKLLIEEIINASEPKPDPQGTNALYWEVDGSFNNKTGIYELIIDPETNTVWHFVYKSK